MFLFVNFEQVSAGWEICLFWRFPNKTFSFSIIGKFLGIIFGESIFSGSYLPEKTLCNIHYLRIFSNYLEFSEVVFLNTLADSFFAHFFTAQVSFLVYIFSCFFYLPFKFNFFFQTKGFFRDVYLFQFFFMRLA